MAQIKSRFGGLFLITLIASAVQAQTPEPVGVLVPPTDPGTHRWFPSSPLPEGQTIPPNGTVAGLSGVFGRADANTPGSTSLIPLQN